MTEEPTDFTSVDLSNLVPAQQVVVNSMLRFQSVYQGDSAKVNEAFETYDEEYSGPRFDLPLLTASISSPQPEENILRYRVWHKSKDPDNLGDSRCVECSTMQEACEAEDRLTKEGYQKVYPPLGVVWDNAFGSFAECRVQGTDCHYDAYEKANKK